MQKYSVLMSVYYKECPKYLEQSVESVFSQTVPTDDFVLVCDGPLTQELEEVKEKIKKKIAKKYAGDPIKKKCGTRTCIE